MRSLWIQALVRMCTPVLDAAGKDQLKVSMPVFGDRADQQYLEAVGRIVCGMSAWLALPSDDTEESRIREQMLSLTVDALANLANDEAKDSVDFGLDAQSLVDGAYLAQGLLRCPGLVEKLPAAAQRQLNAELKKTRRFVPPETNWLLFAAMIEAFLLSRGEEVVAERLMPGVDKFINDYYVGDGLYGDGMHFHFDYYNSFVIHPMLTDILEVMQKHGMAKAETMLIKHKKRQQRYAGILERMISPTGTWPIIGRTLSCRIGAFHALSHAAYKGFLPDDLQPAQVRCALNAVLQTFLRNENNFGANGFLAVGLNGEQPSVAEGYISTGSSYHAMTFFVALGLPAEHDFWARPDVDWTSVRAFSGGEVQLDHAHDENDGGKMLVLKLLRLVWNTLKKRVRG